MPRSFSTGATPRIVRLLLLVALVALAWWLFGNLYEAIVISPNWVIDTPAQLQRLNEFFQRTSPTTYFVPMSQLALLALWTGLILGRARLPRREAVAVGVLSVALAGLTAVIVSVLIPALFGPDFRTRGEELTDYAWWWNLANGVRMALTAGCLALVWRLLAAVPLRNRVATQ